MIVGNYLHYDNGWAYDTERDEGIRTIHCSRFADTEALRGVYIALYRRP